MNAFGTLDAPDFAFLALLVAVATYANARDMLDETRSKTFRVLDAGAVAVCLLVLARLWNTWP